MQANGVSSKERAVMNDAAEIGDHTVANDSTSDDRIEGYEDNISDSGQDYQLGVAAGAEDQLDLED